jgi:hypothetical protein
VYILVSVTYGTLFNKLLSFLFYETNARRVGQFLESVLFRNKPHYFVTLAALPLQLLNPVFLSPGLNKPGVFTVCASTTGVQVNRFGDRCATALSSVNQLS